MADETTKTTEAVEKETTEKVETKSPEQQAKTKATLDRFFKQSARKTAEVERPGKEKKETPKEEVKADVKDEKKEVKEEKKTDAKEEKKEAKVEKAEAKEEKKPEPKKALKPVAKPAEKKEVDIEKLVQSTIKATAKELRTDEKKEEKSYADLPASRIAEIKSIERAEKEGAVHKGATEQATERFRSEQRYIQSWSEKHPGERYDARSDEHDDWYEKNMPQWVEDAADKGNRFSERDDITKNLRDEIEKDVVSPLKKQLEELKNREVEREVLSRVPQQVQQGIGMALEAINPDFLKEGAAKVEDADPLAHRIMLRESQAIIAETHAAMLFMATRGGSLAANDPMREKLISAAMELEEAIKETSKEDQTDGNGRTFVPLDEWAGLSEAQQRKHWTVTGELVAMKLATERAAQIKKSYDEELSIISGMAKAKGWKVGSEATKAAKNGNHEEVPTEEEPEEVEEKPNSPSTAARTVIKPGVDSKAKVPTKGRDMLFRNFTRP